MFKKIVSISALIALTTFPMMSNATTDDGCEDTTIDTLAEPYQLQYRPSMNSAGCGLGSLTDFNLFGGSLGNLMNGDFFKNALCSAVKAKVQPYVSQVNSGVSGINGATSLNQASSTMTGAISGITSGSMPSSSVIINNFSGGTTSNLNQLFH